MRPVEVPVLDPLNVVMFIIAALVASLFPLYRWWTHREGRLGAWIADATSCWSAMILAVLSISALTRSLPFLPTIKVPSEAELIVSNGPLIPFAFSYCALIMLRNLLSEFMPLLDRWRRHPPPTGSVSSGAAASD